jgi:hypothetical protein
LKDGNTTGKNEVFGGVEWETNECFLNTMDNRTSDTLLDAHKYRVHTSITIYSA